MTTEEVLNSQGLMSSTTSTCTPTTNTFLMSKHHPNSEEQQKENHCLGLIHWLGAWTTCHHWRQNNLPNFQQYPSGWCKPDVAMKKLGDAAGQWLQESKEIHHRMSWEKENQCFGVAQSESRPERLQVLWSISSLLSIRLITNKSTGFRVYMLTCVNRWVHSVLHKRSNSPYYKISYPN